MPEEFIGVLTSKRKSWSYREFAPEGLRYTENYEGEFKGVFDAVYFSTADTLDKWPKTREAEFMAAFYLANGDLVLLRGKSKWKLTSPTTTRGESRGTFETKSKKLAWLSGAKARIVGEGSPRGCDIQGLRGAINTDAAVASRVARGACFTTTSPA